MLDDGQLYISFWLDEESQARGTDNRIQACISISNIADWMVHNERMIKADKLEAFRDGIK